MEDSRPEWGRKLSKGCIIPQRIFIVIFATLGLLFGYTLTTSLSITITQIVLPREYAENDKNKVCERDEGTEANKTSGGEHDWNQQEQSWCFLAYYLGYVTSHVPGAIIAQKYGANYVLAGGIFIGAFCVILMPLAIQYTEFYGIIVLRVILGVSLGPMFPCVSVITSYWVPKKERSILGTIILGGFLWGSIIAAGFSGIILQYFKWPIVFYFYGVCSIIWAVLFSLLCHRSPDVHPFIKLKEKEYLNAQIDNVRENSGFKNTPWKAIFASLPVWGVIFAQIGHDWCFYLIIVYLPKYMNDVLQISLKKNSLFSSLPYFCMWVISLFGGAIADCLINKNVMSVTNVRRLMTFISSYGPATFLVLASYAKCNQTLVVASFCLGLGFMAFYFSGYRIANVEMSPNYCGVLMGLSNGLGAISGIFVTFSIGEMTKNTTLEEWRIAFWLAFAIQITCATFYIVVASSEVQPWNETE